MRDPREKYTVLEKVICFTLSITIGGISWIFIAFSHPSMASTNVPPSIVKAAIQILEFKKNDRDWTSKGKPKVQAIERVIGADISRKHRDAAWAAIQRESPKASESEQMKKLLLALEINNLCRQAVAVVVHGKKGWSTVVVSRETRTRLAKACLR